VTTQETKDSIRDKPKMPRLNRLFISGQDRELSDILVKEAIEAYKEELRQKIDARIDALTKEGLRDRDNGNWQSADFKGARASELTELKREILGESKP